MLEVRLFYRAIRDIAGIDIELLQVINSYRKALFVVFILPSHVPITRIDHVVL